MLNHSPSVENQEYLQIGNAQRYRSRTKYLCKKQKYRSPEIQGSEELCLASTATLVRALLDLKISRNALRTDYRECGPLFAEGVSTPLATTSETTLPPTGLND